MHVQPRVGFHATGTQLFTVRIHGSTAADGDSALTGISTGRLASGGWNHPHRQWGTIHGGGGWDQIVMPVRVTTAAGFAGAAS